MMTTCTSCYSTTTNGLGLCALCRQGAGTALEFLSVYFRNLARWRPERAGSRPVPGSRPPKGAFASETADNGADTIARALDEVGTSLTSWVGKLVYERTDLEVPDLEDEPTTITAMCSLLTENLTTIATHDWAGTLVRAITAHEHRLAKLTTDAVPGWYAGTCRRQVPDPDGAPGDTQRCSAPLYVVPGLTWVRCSSCDVSIAARDNLDVILDEAADWIDRPMRLAEILVALLDTEHSTPRLHKRIATWGERERIPVYRRRDPDGDEFGPKLYRLGDVLARLRADGPTLSDSLDDLREKVARPSVIAALLVAKFDAEESVPRISGRIRKWGERGPEAGGIPSHRETDAAGNPTGPRLYRLGDVLDRIDLNKHQEIA